MNAHPLEVPCASCGDTAGEPTAAALVGDDLVAALRERGLVRTSLLCPGCASELVALAAMIRDERA